MCFKSAEKSTKMMVWKGQLDMATMDCRSDLDRTRFGGVVRVNTRMDGKCVCGDKVVQSTLEKVGHFLVKLNDAHIL